MKRAAKRADEESGLSMPPAASSAGYTELQAGYGGGDDSVSGAEAAEQAGAAAAGAAATAAAASSPPAESPPLREFERVIKAVLYGVMNALMAVPVAVAFTSIIFRDPLFREDPTVFPTLIKLVLFSCFVHQCCFSVGSSLPFALGQVQDAGLIFLSAMATQIVHDTEHFEPDATTEERLSTVLISLAVCTALLGVALIVTGHLQLAQHVQYLPLPVVGGYLAFIGLYCGEAGLSMMTNLQIDGLLSLTRGAEQWTLLLQPDAALHAAPGVLCGIALTVATSKLQHYLVLPGCMLMVPGVFYIVLLSAGLDAEDARELGWMKNLTAQEPFYETWVHFNFLDMHWGVLPSLFPTWCGMFLVVAFGSCLDVAAIQLAMGKRLDFNHELKTVGVSNVISGLTGGLCIQNEEFVFKMMNS